MAGPGVVLVGYIPYLVIDLADMLYDPVVLGAGDPYRVPVLPLIFTSAQTHSVVQKVTKSLAVISFFTNCCSRVNPTSSGKASCIHYMSLALVHSKNTSTARID